MFIYITWYVYLSKHLAAPHPLRTSLTLNERAIGAIILVPIWNLIEYTINTTILLHWYYHIFTTRRKYQGSFISPTLSLYRSSSGLLKKVSWQSDHNSDSISLSSEPLLTPASLTRWDKTRIAVNQISFYGREATPQIQRSLAVYNRGSYHIDDD